MTIIQPGEPVQNRLITSLPADEYARAAPHLEFIELVQGEILHDFGAGIDYVFFPNNGMVSLLSVTESGVRLSKSAWLVMKGC
jgi:hypothetical protein